MLADVPAVRWRAGTTLYCFNKPKKHGVVISMSEFVEVALLEKLPVGSGRAFTVAGKQIALFNVGGAIYAILDSCLHKGTPLSYGPLKGKVVTCPWHGWCFDVTTGAMLNAPTHRVPSYETKVEDGKIFVSIA